MDLNITLEEDEIGLILASMLNHEKMLREGNFNDRANRVLNIINRLRNATKE